VVRHKGDRGEANQLEGFQGRSETANRGAQRIHEPGLGRFSCAAFSFRGGRCGRWRAARRQETSKEQAISSSGLRAWGTRHVASCALRGFGGPASRRVWSGATWAGRGGEPKVKGVGRSSRGGPAQFTPDWGLSTKSAWFGIFCSRRASPGARVGEAPSGVARILEVARATRTVARGCKSPGCKSPSETRSGVSVLAKPARGDLREGGLAGQTESKAQAEKASEGKNPRRGSTAGQGQPWVVRTDSQEEQGFEAEEARPKRRLRSPEPGGTGKRWRGRSKGRRFRANPKARKGAS
jgi:hypothetical protein